MNYRDIYQPFHYLTPTYIHSIPLNPIDNDDMVKVRLKCVRLPKIIILTQLFSNIKINSVSFDSLLKSSTSQGKD